MALTAATSLLFVYPYAIVFWALFLVVFVPEFLIVRRGGRRPQPTAQDRGSMRVIMIGNFLGAFVAFNCPFWWPAFTITTGRLAVFWLGMALLAGGSLLRHHCFRMLGSSFKPTVDVRSDQAVVDRGAYRYVRHPSYAAAIVLFLGIGLCQTNWLSLLVIVVMLAVVYGYRMRVEEAALVTTLGDSYHAYMARTKRIVPFVW